MTGAMYAAIAGLKTHMSKMNVIGHNIANVNTNGYKAQRTVFKDAMYTMYRSGSNGTESVGSMNPAQIGYGSQISSIDLNMSAGSYAPGNPLDCMIAGDGFFLVGDKDIANDGVIKATDPNTFKSLQLTRVGDFSFGADGHLVDGSGSCVYGFLTVGTDLNGNPIVSDQLVPIRLPKMELVAVALTTTGGPTVGEEIPAGTAPGGTEGVDYEYVYKVRYPMATAAADGVTATTTQLLDPAAADKKLDDYWPALAAGTTVRETVNPLPFAQMDSISIDAKTGRISGITKDTDEVITIGFLAIGNVTNPNGVTHEGGFYYSCGDGAGDLSISMLGGVQESLQTVGGGTLEYVNGSLAPAQDAAGNPTVLSDKAQITSAGVAELNTGGLEGSNVDLATEISEMITTQRGYQANTRIITVTDTMLEELVNMKR